LLENKERFSKFANKIIRVEVSENSFSSSSWQNEETSWNAIKFGLQHADAEDIIIISSLDEIPDSKILTDIISTNTTFPICFINQFYYFYLNTKYTNDDNTNWKGSYVTKFNKLNINNIYSFVEERKNIQGINGGWHFSFLGDANDAFTKANSYAHREFKHFTKEDYEYCIQNLQDPLNRKSCYNFHSIEKIENLPNHVQSNIQNYKKYLRF
jgi:hypothetical protein